MTAKSALAVSGRQNAFLCTSLTSSAVFQCSSLTASAYQIFKRNVTTDD